MHLVHGKRSSLEWCLGGWSSVTLALKNGEPFQVWILDTGQPADASDFASIEPEEKLRCLCRARERDRQAFVKTRTALRYPQGRGARVAPKSTRFAQNPAIHPFGASHPCRRGRKSRTRRRLDRSTEIAVRESLSFI